MATVSTTSSIDPGILPYITTGLERAKTLFLGGEQPSMYPGQTYVSPSQETLTALQQQQDIASQASPSLQVGQNAYMQSYGGLANTAAGGFLQGNPYQQQMIQAATRPLMEQYSNQVLPGIASLYSKSGRYGSGSMANALGQSTEAYTRALGDVTGALAGQQYQAERQLQQQAQLGQAQLAGQAPSMYAAQYLPSQALAQIGQQQESIAGQPLQEAMQRYSYGQQLPYQQLSGYLSSVYGSPMAGYGTQTSSQNLPKNQTVGILGGAGLGGLLGYGAGQMLGNTFGQYTPQISSGVGALAGGLLGGLF
jgi:hypothetical protein